MTSPDVHPDDMFGDRVVDEFAREVREAAASSPAPVAGAELATIFREGLPPVPEPNRSPAPRQARRRGLALRGAIAGLVAGFALGGLGVAGALPDPVQRQVARAAKVVGVQLPAPDDDVEVEAEDPHDSPVVPATTVVDDEVRPPASTPAVTAPGRVDEDDDAPGRGRGRGRGGDQRDDRAGDADVETPTTTSTAPATAADDETDDEDDDHDDLDGESGEADGPDDRPSRGDDDETDDEGVIGDLEDLDDLDDRSGPDHGSSDHADEDPA